MLFGNRRFSVYPAMLCVLDYINRAGNRDSNKAIKEIYMPKIVDHTKRKQDIAAAACSAISELGIEKVNLIDIGKFAGCTTGAITHYFASKNEVLVAAWDYLYSDFIKQTNIVSAREPYSLIDVLSESLPNRRRSRALTKVWMALTIRSLDNSLLAEKQIETSRLWSMRIQKELRKAQQLGVLDRQTNPDFESQVISIMINGICLRAIMDPNAWPRSRQIKFLRHHVDRLAPG